MTVLLTSLCCCEPPPPFTECPTVEEFIALCPATISPQVNVTTEVTDSDDVVISRIHWEWHYFTDWIQSGVGWAMPHTGGIDGVLTIDVEIGGGPSGTFTFSHFLGGPGDIFVLAHFLFCVGLPSFWTLRFDWSTLGLDLAANQPVAGCPANNWTVSQIPGFASPGPCPVPGLVACVSSLSIII